MTTPGGDRGWTTDASAHSRSGAEREREPREHREHRAPVAAVFTPAGSVPVADAATGRPAQSPAVEKEVGSKIPAKSPPMSADSAFSWGGKTSGRTTASPASPTAEAGSAQAPSGTPGPAPKGSGPFGWAAPEFGTSTPPGAAPAPAQSATPTPTSTPASRAFGSVGGLGTGFAPSADSGVGHGAGSSPAPSAPNAPTAPGFGVSGIPRGVVPPAASGGGAASRTGARSKKKTPTRPGTAAFGGFGTPSGSGLGAGASTGATTGPAASVGTDGTGGAPSEPKPADRPLPEEVDEGDTLGENGEGGSSEGGPGFVVPGAFSAPSASAEMPDSAPFTRQNAPNVAEKPFEFEKGAKQAAKGDREQISIVDQVLFSPFHVRKIVKFAENTIVWFWIEICPCTRLHCANVLLELEGARSWQTRMSECLSCDLYS